jgi:hypothetical protein
MRMLPRSLLVRLDLRVLAREGLASGVVLTSAVQLEVILGLSWTAEGESALECILDLVVSQDHQAAFFACKQMPHTELV